MVVAKVNQRTLIRAMVLVALFSVQTHSATVKDIFNLNTQPLQRVTRDNKYNYLSRYGTGADDGTGVLKPEESPEARQGLPGTVEKRCIRCYDDGRSMDRYDSRSRYDDTKRSRYPDYDDRYDRYDKESSSRGGDRGYDRGYDRYDTRDRYADRDRYDTGSRDRYDTGSRDRYDTRDRYDMRDRYDTRDRYDARDKYDTRDKYDKYESRDRYYDRYDTTRDRYNDRGIGYDNRGFDYRGGSTSDRYRPSYEDQMRGSDRGSGGYGYGRPDSYGSGYASSWNYGGRGDDYYRGGNTKNDNSTPGMDSYETRNRDPYYDNGYRGTSYLYGRPSSTTTTRPSSQDDNSVTDSPKQTNSPSG